MTSKFPVFRYAMPHVAQSTPANLNYSNRRHALIKVVRRPSAFHYSMPETVVSVCPRSLRLESRYCRVGSVAALA